MRRTDLSKFDNSWYKPGSLARRSLWYFISMIFFKNSFPFPQVFKRTLLKIFGAKLGENIILKPSVNIKYPWFFSAGDNVWIGEKVWIDNLAKVSIGDNVVLSQGAFLLTGNHDYKKETFDLMLGEIKIEEGVWVGANSLVTQNVKLGSHSVIGAGSVVTKDTKPYSIYHGNPAAFLKKRVIS
ncbi:MAG: WcaF family extracellular polysaccharide biosynthesis acetyltransferase [Candidatus Aminicenantes bacterium]|nr:WcaF family extracellular polysaccharide biosynthesis acetyltransferase [Candidatus Aminicenantes bacterium]